MPQTRLLPLLMILSTLISAAVATAQPRGVPKEIAVKTLGNGLTIIVWPDHDIPSVALYNWFRVGSRNERPGLTGLSHFFEHMMFNGSKRFAPGEFDRTMAEHGGANNAFTSNDVTVYQDWFPRSALETIFKLEGDRLCCLSIDSTVVESERGVVSAERRSQVDDDNRGFLDEQIQTMAFLAHPYNIPVIGWPSDIERWSLRDLKDYFRVHYAPNNATLIVVGDVTPAEIFALAEKYIGPISAQPEPDPVTTVEPPQAGERRLTVRRPGQVPLIQVAYHVGAGHGPDVEAEDLLRTIHDRRVVPALSPPRGPGSRRARRLLLLPARLRSGAPAHPGDRRAGQGRGRGGVGPLRRTRARREGGGLAGGTDEGEERPPGRVLAHAQDHRRKGIGTRRLPDVSRGLATPLQRARSL